MSADFSITVDQAGNLVHITMSGMFTPEHITAFVEARNAAHLQLTCPANAHVTLNDVRGMKIQAQPIVAAFRQVLADPAYQSRKLAFLVTPSLTARQLWRALDVRDARCFDNMAEAKAWLMADPLPEPYAPGAIDRAAHRGGRAA